ncbi:MAG: cytochrome c biogenesis protein ResB [Spirochaetales bacterium]|jgi:cytochrome c biogenesis protein|nr:cytochrome c biogenesis protein ResB [Spirochaetales bacterium]
MLKRIFTWLRSLRLTLALVLYMVITGGLSTFVPQHLEGQEYFQLYSPSLARLVLAVGMDDFFSSLPFLIPAGLFFVNLLACTVFRFRRELRKKGRKNFGPDILHGGLILFMISAALSVFNRMDGTLRLGVGESALLPNGNTLILDDLEYRQYDNGRPLAWISYLTVLEGERILYTARPLEVNHPLKLNGFSLYQYSYGNMGGREYTVIMAVRDPGYTLVFISFILCIAGLGLTALYKLRRNYG